MLPAHSYDELVALVGALRDRLAALEAENARLRAEVAHRRTHDDPPPPGTAPVPSVVTPADHGEAPGGDQSQRRHRASAVSAYAAAAGARTAARRAGPDYRPRAECLSMLR